MKQEKPFWAVKSLEEMSQPEWESLCDGCGRCCLHKLRYEPGNELAYTNVACRLLDLHTCQCSRYATRHTYVPDCVTLTPAALAEIDWLPPSCAYRRIKEGRKLAWWHRLVCGDADMVHKAGVSVSGRAVDERYAGPLEHHIVDWPGKPPRARKSPPASPQNEDMT